MKCSKYYSSRPDLILFHPTKSFVYVIAMENEESEAMEDDGTMVEDRTNTASSGQTHSRSTLKGGTTEH